MKEFHQVLREGVFWGRAAVVPLDEESWLDVDGMLEDRVRWSLEVSSFRMCLME